MDFIRDITFCDRKECKRRKTCHRSNDNPQSGDTFFIFEKDYDDDNCEYYYSDNENMI